MLVPAKSARVASKNLCVQKEKEEEIENENTIGSFDAPGRRLHSGNRLRGAELLRSEKWFDHRSHARTGSTGERTCSCSPSSTEGCGTAGYPCYE